MKKLIYFIEFIFIYIFFILFKILGYRISSNLGFSIGKLFGPIFRSKNSIIENLKKSNISLKQSYSQMANNVLGNYGRVFSEYPFLKNFRNGELKNFIEAVDNFKKFLEMQPKHPRAHFGLGTAYSMIGKQGDARKHYENAIDYDPKFLSPYINLANLNMATGKIIEAKKLLTGVLLKNPNFAGAHKNLGIIFLQENDFNNASQHLNQYLLLEPLAPDTAVIQSILKNKSKRKSH